ncbi:MAG: YbaN family protein [Eubacteriales bacterium]|nr:YbaN family protein [Eubacteriales bacterium]
MMLKNRLLIILGFLFLGIGAVGIAIPVLPTTPFVLLAAVCFSGNPRLTAWLHKNSIFSNYITNYKERNGLKKRTVVISLVFLWTMLGISIAFIQKLWAAVLLPCIGLAVTIHILCIARPKNTKGV